VSQPAKVNIPVKPGNFKKLPLTSVKFRISIAWKAEEKLDFDLWLSRRHSTGLVEVLAWPFHQYDREDLGKNSQGLPFQAFPELDVITSGDDRDGSESDANEAKGVKKPYDESAELDWSKAPTTVVGYVPWVTIYDHEDQGLTLGQASELSCVVEDLGTNTRYVTDPASIEPASVCFVPGKLQRAADGKGLEIHGTAEKDQQGTTDDAWKVAQLLGAKIKAPGDA
jgi:hypothetical protein